MSDSFAQSAEIKSDNSDLNEGEAFSPEFVQCLETEAELLKAAIADGATPMLAHARTLMWLDSLVKMHAIGLEQSIESNEAPQTAVWSRDLATLEFAMALVQSVKPLEG
jgi:hypothetical protein